MEIWHDKWISRTTSSQPVTRLSEAPMHLFVDLIIDDTGEWNSELVREVFIPPDADAILSMPRPRVACDDGHGKLQKKTLP